MFSNIKWRLTSEHSRARAGAGLAGRPCCPRCGNARLKRIRRRVIDRLLSWVYPVRRFACHGFGCDWEGNIARHRLQIQASVSTP